MLKKIRVRRRRIRKEQGCCRRQPIAARPKWAGRVLNGRASFRRFGKLGLQKRALQSYRLALKHQPVEAYRLARYVLACQPYLAPLVARTALVLAEEDVPLEGLDLLETLLNLGYTEPQLIRAYARILGSLGYHREALIAQRQLWVLAGGKSGERGRSRR